jgi:hypothetical protein
MILHLTHSTLLEKISALETGEMRDEFRNEFRLTGPDT